MASTTVQTVDVKCIDSDGNQTTYKIDNPKNNITRLEIVNAFNYGIQNGIIKSSYDNPIVSVGTTSLSTSTKTEIEGEPVYITPSSITLSNVPANGSIESATVVVSNATVQAAAAQNLKINGNVVSNYYATTSINEQATQVTVSFTTETNTQGGKILTAELLILINNKPYIVPVSGTRVL